MSKPPTQKIVENVSLGLLAIMGGSAIANVIFNWGLVTRSFVWIWLFAYLFAITLSLRNSLKEHPDQNQMKIIEWAAAMAIGLTVGIVLLSFIR